MFKLGDTFYVDMTTHSPTTGAVSDADGTPTCEVFEETNDTAIYTPTVVKRTAKTGDYRTPFVVTGGNGFDDAKTYNAVWSATVGGITAKAVFTFTLESKHVSNLNDLAAGALMGLADNAITSAKIDDGAITSSEAPALAYLTGNVALDSTVAKEATINAKIPTALSFSGANVNAESKITAAPTDMALNSTVAKSGGTKGTDNIHDDLDTHNTLLGTKIPTALSFSGANVNAESKVTAAPTDMALNSTVAKEAMLTTVAGYVDGLETDVTFLKRFFTNKKLWNDVNKQWDVYNDAGDVVLYHWRPETKTAGDVTMSDTAFANTDKVEVA